MSVRSYGNRLGIIFYYLREIVARTSPLSISKAAKRLKRLRDDPQFGVKRAASARETMMRLRADPVFMAKLRTAQQAAGRKTIERLNADPKFKARLAARASDRMKRLHAQAKTVQEQQAKIESQDIEIKRLRREVVALKRKKPADWASAN